MPPQLHILRTRLFWLGMIPTVFLTWIWLASATRYIDIGNNRWQQKGAEIHNDFTVISIDTGCLFVKWASQEYPLGVSGEPPEKWTYESEKQEWTLVLLPRFLLSYEPTPGEPMVKRIAIPFWVFPLLWTAFWIWRWIRTVRKERKLFLATHLTQANSE